MLRSGNWNVGSNMLSMFQAIWTSKGWEVWTNEVTLMLMMGLTKRLRCLQWSPLRRDYNPIDIPSGCMSKDNIVFIKES